MDNRKIGVFDSGLGGLTCVKQLMQILPGEGIIYFGDTARVPYGSRSKETIIQYTKEDIAFLLKHDIKCIVSACGTASSVALDAVAGSVPVPLIGIVEPAARVAAAATRNKKVGVLGTVGTVRSGKYEEKMKACDPALEVVSASCPLFVPLVENGYTQKPATRLIAEEYLAPLQAAGVDTVILGCTHYPLLTGVIAEIMGPDVVLINPGAEAAKCVKTMLQEKNALAEVPAEPEFFVSDCPESFAQLGGAFLERKISYMVTRVSME